MNDAETAEAVADAVTVVIQRGAAVTDRFVLATAELGQRVQEFLDADRAIMGPRGGDVEQMAAGRRLSAARRALAIAVSKLAGEHIEAGLARLAVDVEPTSGWQGRVLAAIEDTRQGLPRPEMPAARHSRIGRAWRWLWHGAPW